MSFLGPGSVAQRRSQSLDENAIPYRVGVQMSNSMAGIVLPTAVVPKSKGIRQQRLGEEKTVKQDRRKRERLL